MEDVNGLCNADEDLSVSSSWDIFNVPAAPVRRVSLSVLVGNIQLCFATTGTACESRLVVPMFGRTATGKSTNANWLLCNPLRKIDDGLRKISYVLADPLDECKHFAVGTGAGSCTKSGKFLQIPDTNVHLCDIPGDDDTDPLDRITNCVVKERALHPSSECRFIPVLNLACSLLNSGAGKDLATVIQNFVNVFHPDGADLDPDYYKKRCLVFITHVPRGGSPASAINQFKDGLKDALTVSRPAPNTAHGWFYKTFYKDATVLSNASDPLTCQDVNLFVADPENMALRNSIVNRIKYLFEKHGGAPPTAFHLDVPEDVTNSLLSLDVELKEALDSAFEQENYESGAANILKQITTSYSALRLHSRVAAPRVREHYDYLKQELNTCVVRLLSPHIGDIAAAASDVVDVLYRVLQMDVYVIPQLGQCFECSICTAQKGPPQITRETMEPMFSDLWSSALKFCKEASDAELAKLTPGADGTGHDWTTVEEFIERLEALDLKIQNKQLTDLAKTEVATVPDCVDPINIRIGGILDTVVIAFINKVKAKTLDAADIVETLQVLQKAAEHLRFDRHERANSRLSDIQQRTQAFLDAALKEAQDAVTAYWESSDASRALLDDVNARYLRLFLLTHERSTQLEHLMSSWGFSGFLVHLYEGFFNGLPVPDPEDLSQAILLIKMLLELRQVRDLDNAQALVFDEKIAKHMDAVAHHFDDAVHTPILQVLRDLSSLGEGTVMVYKTDEQADVALKSTIRQINTKVQLVRKKTDAFRQDFTGLPDMRRIRKKYESLAEEAQQVLYDIIPVGLTANAFLFCRLQVHKAFALSSIDFDAPGCRQLFSPAEITQELTEALTTMVEPLRRKYDIFKPELYHWPRIKQDCVLLDAIRAIHVPPSCQDATFRDTAAEVHHVLQGKVEEYYQHCGQEFHKNAAEGEPNLRQAYDLLCHLQAIAQHFPLSPASEPRIDEVECRTGQLRDLVVKIAQAPSQWSLDQLQQYCVHLSGMSSPEFTACKDQITQYITASQQHTESLIERAKQALVNTDFEAFRRCAPNLEPAHWQILIPDVEESMLRSLSVLKPIVSAPVITVAAANGDRVHVQKIVNFLEQCRDSSLLRRFPVDTTIANECTTALETLREKRSAAQAKLIQCFELPSLRFSDLRQCFGMGYLYNTRAIQATVEEKVMQLGSQFLSAEVSDVVLDEMNKFFELGCDSVIVTTLSLEGLVQLAKDKLRQQFNILADTIVNHVRNQDLHLAEEKLGELRGRLHNQPSKLQKEFESVVKDCERNVSDFMSELLQDFEDLLDMKLYADAIEVLNAHCAAKKTGAAGQMWRRLRPTAIKLVEDGFYMVSMHRCRPPRNLQPALDEAERLANALSNLRIGSESRIKQDVEQVRTYLHTSVADIKQQLANSLQEIKAAALNHGSDASLERSSLNGWLHAVTDLDTYPGVGTAECLHVGTSIICFFTSIEKTLAVQLQKLRHADAAIDFEWLNWALLQLTPPVTDSFMNFCTKHDVAADVSVFVNAPTITEELKASGERLAADALLKLRQRDFRALGHIRSILFELSSKCNVHGPHQQVKAALGEYVAELEFEVTTKFNQDCDAGDAMIKLVQLQNQHKNQMLNSECYDAVHKVNGYVQATLERMSANVRTSLPLDDQSTKIFASDTAAIFKKHQLVNSSLTFSASFQKVPQVLSRLFDERWRFVMNEYSGTADAEDMARQHFRTLANILEEEHSEVGSELVRIINRKSRRQSDVIDGQVRCMLHGACVHQLTSAVPHVALHCPCTKSPMYILICPLR